MATKTIQVSLPGELGGYVERKVKSGRYEDAGEVVREALRQMEAAELAGELKDFERAFAGGHDLSETEEEVRRIEAAVQAVSAEILAEYESRVPEVLARESPRANAMGALA
jgi:putative addiction module CopG family antidote